MKLKLPSLYLDEHISSSIMHAFKALGFRTISLGTSRKFKGKDEREFIGKLYSDNGIFVTSDGEFINEAMDRRIKHAGLIFIPKAMLEDEKETFAWIVGGYVKGGTNRSIYNFRGHLVYPGYEGLHDSTQKKDEMVVSWDWLSDNG